MKMNGSRREFLGAMGMTAGACIVQPALLRALSATDARVAIGRCSEYNSDVMRTLATMFDQLGGLHKLVRGKTVAIKLNLTASLDNLMNGMPPGMTHWPSPQVVAAVVHLLGQAGAQRIRLLESAKDETDSLQHHMMSAGWNVSDFTSAAKRVEFENTNLPGSGKTYINYMVPGGGMIYTGYQMNQSYRDTDVFVSLAKLKEHVTAGVTLSMKNLFGMPPTTIYGDRAGVDEPALVPIGSRGQFHSGNRPPSKSAPPPVDFANWSHDGGYRVPRIVVDLVQVRPIHLAVIDGIYTIEGGEEPQQGPKRIHRPIHPGVLIAGLNCVSTDAVATAVMGFDPMADRGTTPFETCDSTLKLAEGVGLGTRDLSRIEVLGASIDQVRCPFTPLSQMMKA